ncbi:4-(cytidine 5'-diphospho)-2-C-methyl-D-erythritol kinase [Candidatus Magnetaquicoccus inordinatus]|uniref:4-(cytidine 5'-diphospho)-2-C-methyl-D-erythritol kinase n=1 Tax=Candidatus Magnetaquicoccus inordinatus TaxID=2496818 RepID=UPI00102CAEC4|nr:4-(cytidine 5'-diphospho)-2-C-methyl-D-erythritol kinase [Candidatus Magnetaquicoccus inordinatus]
MLFPPCTFTAPAKVNLGLRIVGRREDGYHRLWSVMSFFPLYDHLTFTADQSAITLRCEPSVTDHAHDNLVWQAAWRLQQESGIRSGVHIHLHKAIPHGAGLGGGSSDAALTLLALNQLWQLHWSQEQLLALGVQLGADVPFFLGQTTALAEGIGEQLTFLPSLPQLPLLLIYPGCTLSTAQVFRQWHSERAAGEAYNTPPLAIPTAKEALVQQLHNDLQATAIKLQPEIALLDAALRRHGALAALMSGSGSAFFGIFRQLEEAKEAARSLRTRHPDWQIFPGVTFNQHPFSSAWESAIKGAVANGWAVAKR